MTPAEKSEAVTIKCIILNRKMHRSAFDGRAQSRPGLYKNEIHEIHEIQLLKK